MSRSTVDASGSEVTVEGVELAGGTDGIADGVVAGRVVGCGTLTACRRGEKLSKRLVTCR
jgi:hypothetical protein